PTGDLHRDLALLEAAAPRSELIGRTEALERESVMFPLMAIALLAPLCIHFIVAGAWIWPKFDQWIAVSYVLVGHSHLVLAYLGWSFARRVCRTPTEDLATVSHGGWRAYWIVVGSSAFPGAVLLMIPIALVAVTGLFIPWLFRSL